MSRAVVCCVLANVVGGSTYVAIEYASVGLPDVTLTVLRMLVAVPMFVVLAAHRGVLRWRYDRRERGLLAILALPGFAIPVLIGVIGVRLSTPGNASILALLEPIAIVPLSLLFLAERVPPWRLAGIATGLFGALLVITAGHLPGGLASRQHLIGNLLLALQGTLWAVYTVSAKPLLRRHPALGVSTHTMLIGLLVLAAAIPLEWSALRPATLDGFVERVGLPQARLDGAALASLPWAVYLGAVGTFLGVLLWNAGLKGVDASRMAGFIFLQPCVGLLLDYACFGRVPEQFALLGAVLILLAVVLVSREPKAEVRHERTT